jgi:hypothetical protein
MSSPFEICIVPKVEGEEIVVESLSVPMWHLLVSYLSTGSILNRVLVQLMFFGIQYCL